MAQPEFNAVSALSLIVKVVPVAGLPTIRVSATAASDPDNKISNIQNQCRESEVNPKVSFSEVLSAL